MPSRYTPKLERRWIDPFAISLVERLQRKGFQSYLVGGCVRDLLAGQQPKDFDIVTDARPEQIKATIDRAYIIGKRFRLVLVKRGEDQFEVATFRKDPPPEESLNEDGLQVADNTFGSPEEDARRRDFRVNSLFYDPVKNEVVDYCDGLKDIEDRMIRIIGDPMVRLTEDPIRILRALRLAHKLDFTIEPQLREAIVEKAPLLQMTALPRRREELLKILRLNDPTTTLHESHDLGVLKHTFPSLDTIYSKSETVDDFDSYLMKLSKARKSSLHEPMLLFGVLILAFYRSFLHQDPHSQPDVRASENTRLIEFMKRELGIFNLEASTILNALDLQCELADVAEFERRGARRRKGFLRNESLPLALVFAELDHVLPPNVLSFWKQQLDANPQEPVEEKRPRRRRRRRKESDSSLNDHSNEDSNSATKAE